MEVKEIETKIPYSYFGDMMVVSEWISGKSDRRKYLKWMKSHKNYQALHQTFDDESISKYFNYIETLKDFDIESIECSKPNIWIIDKFLHVKTSESNDRERFKFALMGKPLQKNNTCFVKKFDQIIQTIKDYSSFGEYLNHVMQKPENNHVWVSYMKTRLILDDKPFNEIEENINFNIFEFVDSYQSDPIIIKWSQHCALCCIVKDLTF